MLTGIKQGTKTLKSIQSLVLWRLSGFFFYETIYLTCQDKFEDSKGALLIRSRKLKKDRQYNIQKKKDKKINNDLQNIALKT